MLEELKKINYNNEENKIKMNNLMIKMLDNLKETDSCMYDKINCEIYEIVYGKILNDDITEKWVSCMNPAAKWSKDSISNVKNTYNINMPLNDLYAIMNMLYSDFNNILGSGDDEESLQKYIKATNDWYYDSDAKYTESEKTYMYATHIVGI